MDPAPDTPASPPADVRADPPPRPPVPVRLLAGTIAAVTCAATALLVASWHSPENFFQFNARSIPWAYLWSVGLLSAALFASAAVLLRGALTALAWVGGGLIALSATGLVESFWFAFQVLQGDGATHVLPYARGYAVVLALALVLTWAAVLLSRRQTPSAVDGRGRRSPKPARPPSEAPGRLSG